jgi:hypothetical protein
MNNASLENRLRVAVALTACAALATPALLVLTEPGTNALLITAIAVVLLLPVGIRLVQRRFDPFEPLFVFVLAYGAMFVVRPAAQLSREELYFAISFEEIPIDGTFTQTLVIALIGACGFMAGYFATWGRRTALRIPTPPVDINDSKAITAAWVLTATAVFLFYMFLVGAGEASPGIDLFLAGRSPELEALYRDASAYYYSAPYLLIPAALIFFSIGLVRGRTSLLVAAAGVVVLMFAMTSPTGSRIMLFPLVVALIICFYAIRERRPRTVTLVALGFLALFLSAVLLQTREADLRQAQTTGSVVSRIAKEPSRIFEPVTHGDDAAEMPALAAALTVVPSELEHTYGTSLFGDLVTRPVPRSLWAGKPLPPREEVISTLWPRLYALHAANPEFTVLLTFYMDFGYAGVLFGLMGFGLVARLLFAYYDAHRGRIGAKLIYASAVPFMVGGVRDSAVDTITRAAFVVLPLMVVVYLATAEGWSWRKPLRSVRELRTRDATAA